MKKKTREEMIHEVIRRYGHEHPWVIGFCKFCEEWEDKAVYNEGLENLYIAMMSYKETEEEE